MQAPPSLHLRPPPSRVCVVPQPSTPSWPREHTSLLLTSPRKVSSSISWVTVVPPTSRHLLAEAWRQLTSSREGGTRHRKVIRSDHSRATFITGYCDSYSVLLLVIVDLVLCLLDKLNFNVGLRVSEERLIHVGFSAMGGFRHTLGAVECPLPHPCVGGGYSPSFATQIPLRVCFWATQLETRVLSTTAVILVEFPCFLSFPINCLPKLY